MRNGTVHRIRSLRRIVAIRWLAFVFQPQILSDLLASIHSMLKLQSRWLAAWARPCQAEKEACQNGIAKEICPFDVDTIIRPIRNTIDLNRTPGLALVESNQLPGAGYHNRCLPTPRALSYSHPCIGIKT
jgi:hypothetical protein